MKSGADFCYVTFAAELSDEAPGALERICDARHNRFWLFHPVQCGVGKNRIKLPSKRKLMAIHHRNVQSAIFSRLELGKTRIHSNHGAAITCNLLRQDRKSTRLNSSHL